ncbi:MAG TPA: YihY/virulence factor BrkB family protein [Bryobacteraceae bacterium]
MAEWWALRALSWSDLAKRTWREVWDDEVFAKSARLAFYFFFALFPVLLLLVMLLAETGTSGSQFRAALLDAFNQVLPANASALIAKTVHQQSTKAILGTGAIAAGISAIWGALNGTWAIVAALNDAYEVKEKRSWRSLSAVVIGLTISLSVLDLIALVIILYGTQAGKIVLAHLGGPASLEILWRVGEWVVIVVLLLFSFALLYRFGPNIKNRRWQWSTPGAVIAVILWVVATLLLRVYQEHFGSSRIYGGMNAVVTLLLWLYCTGAAVLIGGEANSEIEKAAARTGRPGGKH